MTEHLRAVRPALWAVLLLAVAASLTIVWAQRAAAYTCDSAAFAPFNWTNDNGKVKVRGKGTASCPSTTQSKSLKVTLVRVVNLLPDVTIDERTDAGSKPTYKALPTGCDVAQLRGYKSVEVFTGNPQHTSGQNDLTCQL